MHAPSPPPPAGTWLPWCGVALLALTCRPVGVAAKGPPPRDMPPVPVRVAAVERREVNRHHFVTGDLRPVRRSLVAAEESGRVLEAPPDAGTAVATGTVLARLDDTLSRIQRLAMATVVEEARAMVMERDAELRLARRRDHRLTELTQRGATTEDELEDARDRLAVAEARMHRADVTVQLRASELQQYDERLERMRVAAPFDGVVVRKVTEIGQWVSRGDVIAELIETTSIDAVLDVPQFLLPNLDRAQEIEVSIDALRATRRGRVHRIVPDADAAARTFPVMIRLPNADGTLKPGMSVAAQVPTTTRISALTVPRDAVWTTPTGTRLYAHRGATAVPVAVTVRFGIGDRFVIDGAVREGEEVVIEGNERLRPGAPLRVLPAAPSASAATKP